MTFSKELQIGPFRIGPGHPTFIIAEAGVNHDGDFGRARELIDVAAESGVHAVKFQAFRTEALILDSVEKAGYQQANLGNEDSQFEMLQKLELTRDETADLKAYCEKRGILFLTTPFDEPSLEELDVLDLDAYKVSSTDLTNLPFLSRVAGKGKPIILSTGMSYMPEIQAALAEIHPINQDLILLQCTANYPVVDEEVNLNVMDSFRDELDVLIGFSDHSVGIGASPFAVAKGAVVIEKHFTLDAAAHGPDHQASLTPSELTELVLQIRRVESFLGTSEKSPTPSELPNRNSLQKCFVASRTIEKGETLSLENMVAKRTGGQGVSPIHYKTLVGKPADRAYQKNEIINE